MKNAKHAMQNRSMKNGTPVGPLPEGEGEEKISVTTTIVLTSK
jgi:hypothetical protein